VVNDLGIKGLGELGNVGTNAAVANAVYHATGVRIRELPIRLEKLLDSPSIAL
jgi:xanthine dehydrogenase YagR molybdenum-binding subunit